MTTKLNQPWIPIERIESFVQAEPAIVTFGLAILAVAFYRLVLRKKLSPERRANMERHFRNLYGHTAVAVFLFALFALLRFQFAETRAAVRISSYVGLLTVLSGSTVFAKTCRIVSYEYLFFRHQKTGVPILIVNFITLMLWVLLAGWVVTDIFNLKVAPLLATSAIFSLVLGLALQDTLGNLLAGVALQFDKPYEIGDWVEIYNGGQKRVGLVQEISWRATVLLAFGEEILTIPNRVMAQAEIFNFSAKQRPFIRGQVFRFPYGTPIEKAKSILLEAARSHPGVFKQPAPAVWITEAAESWLSMRLIYWTNDYSNQFGIGGDIIESALQGLKAAGIELASPRILVRGDLTSRSSLDGFKEVDTAVN